MGKLISQFKLIISRSIKLNVNSNERKFKISKLAPIQNGVPFTVKLFISEGEVWFVNVRLVTRMDIYK